MDAKLNSRTHLLNSSSLQIVQISFCCNIFHSKSDAVMQIFLNADMIQFSLPNTDFDPRYGTVLTVLEFGFTLKNALMKIIMF